jgi:hypothetical protein
MVLQALRRTQMEASSEGQKVLRRTLGMLANAPGTACTRPDYTAQPSHPVRRPPRARPMRPQGRVRDSRGDLQRGHADHARRGFPCDTRTMRWSGRRLLPHPALFTCPMRLGLLPSFHKISQKCTAGKRHYPTTMMQNLNPYNDSSTPGSRFLQGSQYPPPMPPSASCP